MADETNTPGTIGDAVVNILDSLQGSKNKTLASVGQAVNDTETKLAIQYINTKMPLILTAIAVIFLLGFFLGRKK